jgi:asparagine synthase (glutamine-hydrolysing)
MCGIAGIYNTKGEPPDQGVLERMAAAIAHRGPDGERFYVEGGLGLAHRHLRIIDLSDAAMQPMTNEDGSLQLIFNGEIYNYIELRPELEAKGHVFASHSDTETLLHAYEEWGVSCLERFNGMFAFALWDSRKRRLFIARDRLGVKPLYYRWHDNTLAFASEIKALLAHPGIEVTPHLPAIAEYMNAMYTTGEHTWFAGIKRLLPGHFMVVQPDGLRIKQWWDVPSGEDAPGQRPERYYVQTTRDLLEDSVRLRLRSDVPLGAHLSGGIDSSAVVALLSKQLASAGEPVRTFSGAFGEGQAYDERRYVRTVVRRYKTEHRETLPCASDLPFLLDKMVWHMDEPAAGPGILLQWAVCALSRQSGVTVVNGGQGGDEAWAGYFGYIPAYLRTLLRQARKNPFLLMQVAGDTLKMAQRPSTRSALARALRTRRRGRLRSDASSGEWASELFTSRISNCQEDALAAGESEQVKRTPLAAETYWDIKWYLPALLHVEDRTSMAFSLESRAPLLDYRIIEHAATVPSALKMKGLTTKHVLREAVRDLLPTPIYRRTDKMGMPTPVAPWFRGGLAPWVNSQLLCDTSSLSGLISEAYIKQAIAEHASGKRDRSTDIWKVLNVEAWWRAFIRS